MAVSIKEALEMIDTITTTPSRECVCLEEALGRVVAKDYRALYNLPNFDNSAMDGYAVRLADAGKKVKVVATILASQESQIELHDGIAIKIMTGAKLPKGTEAIVPIEDVKIEGSSIILPSSIKPKAHMRFAGEDVKKDENIVKRGAFITAYTLGLLASQGYSYIEVFKPVKVALFATGSELKMHYEKLQTSHIYNSNTPALLARAKELGCEVSFIGKIEDSKEAIKEAIKNALDANLIVTSGGVSVGEADFTKEAFQEMGMQLLFSKVDIKPGKPTTLGKIGDTYILNLPGNPLAAVLNFEIFGRFLINKLSNRQDPYIQPIKAKLKQKLFNKPGRDTLIPGSFDGEYFYPFAKRSPGMVTPAATMDGFIIVRKDVKELSGEVNFIPLTNLTSPTFKELASY